MNKCFSCLTGQVSETEAPSLRIINFMAKILDNIILLPNLDKESKDILILRLTEKEIEHFFSEIIQIKLWLKF